jgi:hypothetical protein
VGLSLFAASLFSVSTVSLAEAKNAVGAACKDCNWNRTDARTCHQRDSKCTANNQLNSTVSESPNDGTTVDDKTTPCNPAAGAGAGCGLTATTNKTCDITK